MKKPFIVLANIFLLLVLTSCVLKQSIPYQGERPSDYPRSKWISESPVIWFEVLENSGYEKPELVGCAEIYGESIEIKVMFDATECIYISEVNNQQYGVNDIKHLQGECEFTSMNCIVTVDKDSDTLFGGQYDTITFVREPNAT